MVKTSQLRVVLAGGCAAVTSALILAACGPEDDGTVAPRPASSPSRLAAATPGAVPNEAARPPALLRGTIISIAPWSTGRRVSGAGALLGGVLGAAVGSQVGGGDGRKVASVAGAVGGAIVGHEIEKSRQSQTAGYRITVRMDNGGTRTFDVTQLGPWATGQRVLVEDERLRPA